MESNGRRPTEMDKRKEKKMNKYPYYEVLIWEWDKKKESYDISGIFKSKDEDKAMKVYNSIELDYDLPEVRLDFCTEDDNTILRQRVAVEGEPGVYEYVY